MFLFIRLGFQSICLMFIVLSICLMFIVPCVEIKGTYVLFHKPTLLPIRIGTGKSSGTQGILWAYLPRPTVLDSRQLIK